MAKPGSRLDRLVTLLETGSNSLIRDTAAKQLADLQKDHPDELFNFLAKVVPFLQSSSWDTRRAAAKAIAGIVDNTVRFDPNEDEDPSEVKSEANAPADIPVKQEDGIKSEAGSKADVEADADADAASDDSHKLVTADDQLALRTLDLPLIISKGQKLLGSDGKKFDYALASLDSAERHAVQKRSLTGRLGLGEYMEEEPGQAGEQPGAGLFGADGKQSVASHRPRSTDSNVSPFSASNATNVVSPTDGPRRSNSTSEETGGMSKRQLNQLKRKAKASAKSQARKVRVMDLGGPRSKGVDSIPSPVLETPKQEIKQEDGQDGKAGWLSLDRSGPDDDTKMVSEFKGDIVPEKPAFQTEAEEEGLEWPFERLCDILAVQLFDPSWEVRHGAAGGLREIIRAHGAGAGRRRGRSRRDNDRLNQAWLDDMACRYCCVLMLDRFGDWSSDKSVAPIRESVAQALGTAMLHLPPETLDQLYSVLHRMVMQQELDLPRRVWEVCHGGMLGLQYLGAIRKDMMMKHLDGIVEAAIQGLNDSDDDVRAVGAAVLLPIAEDLVRLRPELLRSLLNIIWDCLGEIRDDLSSSTGYVMDLLAKLSNHEEVLQAMKENAQAETAQDGFAEHSFERLVPRLYVFLRHTLPNVRCAVLRALQTFLKIEDDTTKAWVDARILRLVFQNVLLERYEEPLELSLQLWNELVTFLSNQNKLKQVFDVNASQLLSLTTHPIGVPRANIPMDQCLIMKPTGQFLKESTAPAHPRPSSPANGEEPKKRRRRADKKEEPPSKMHNVDGHMLKGDVDLIGYDTLVRSRLYAARAFGEALVLEEKEDRNDALYDQLYAALSSDQSTTVITAAIILEEQLRRANSPVEVPPKVVSKLQSLVDDERPAFYADLVLYLQITRAQCQSLLNAFRDQGRIQPQKIPTIAVVVQGDVNAGPNAFGITDAEKITTEDYDRLFNKSMSTVQRMTARKPIEEAKEGCLAAVKEYKKLKAERDVRVKAAAAAALVALQHIPKRAGKLIKGLMDGVVKEELFQLQKRSATAVGLLLKHYSMSASRGPADKIVGNLAKFYCIDTSDTPEFPPNADLRDAILSMRKEEDRKDHQDAASYEAEARSARVTRRGAKEALDQLSFMFGKDLFKHAPILKQQIQGPLSEVFKPDQTTELGDITPEVGQQVVDAFSILRVLVPTLDKTLEPFIDEMLPYALTALQCNVAVFRYAAAKCFASICSHYTIKGMTILVEKVLSTINNPVSVFIRQGAIETAYHLIHLMEERILPYVVFLIVPILGRMSDSNQDIRLIATTAFATLVKLVPLEAGIPDPPGFSEDLLKGRDKERKFVAQMLDPKKTEPFEIPVAIKAKLRSYQQEGVNWLYFLNRFNLHGVLCDDMGLGKTLQTLCIVASDHHIRAEEYAKTKDPSMRRLPSLIICPPTLSGHWLQEIATYAPFLTAVAYVGPSAERSKVRSKMYDADIVITSYDVCRNDVDNFAPYDWNYCVLDEGHLIKNPRAKTTLAVKRIKSNHRLILSGTPIQNNVLELWSLFDFLMPGFLGSEKVFHERFAKPIAASRNAKSSSREQEKGALAIESLHKQVLPFLLRRLKEEVLEDLPPKIIQNYYCDLSDLQKRLFDDFAKKEKKAVEANAGNESKEAKQHIFQALQYMRKLCNSPSLVLKPGHRQYEAITQQLSKSKSTLKDVAHAPKLSALRDLLLDCGIGAPPPPEGELGTQENYVSPHRALIFCQMKEMLDIVQEDVLRKLLPGVQYLRLDGGVEANRRQDIVNTFNRDPSYDVLLLTTSVGGLGLNLTGADTVIFVEHDWNPQKDMQAMDRAHRIGQKKVVNVYRLITRGTLEEKILNLQRFKMDVASTVVNQQNAGLGTMGTDQLLDLFDLDTSGDSGVPRPLPESEGVVDINGGANEEESLDVTGDIRQKGKAGVLDGLQELWDDTQYKEEYNLDEFLKTMK